jgi:hypothetical protein
MGVGVTILEVLVEIELIDKTHIGAYQKKMLKHQRSNFMKD